MKSKITSVGSSVLLIYTGGTIGMKTDPETGVLVPFDFNDIQEEIPAIRNLGVEIGTLILNPIDSSNVTPQLWVDLAMIIRDNYDKYDGFVVLHGTDTMSYTASALSFMLENLSKPVVFTGSQIPMGVLRTDGRENLVTAIEIAAAKDDGRAVVPEVCLYFQNSLFRANRTTKHSAEELDAFRSENYPPLAEVGVSIHFNRQNIMPLADGEFKIHTRMESDLMVVKIFPGLTEGFLRGMLSVEGVKGVILETYGAGNAPTTGWFIDTVTEFVRKGLPVVNVTQCRNGSVAMELYETGVKLQQAGVISGYDSTFEAAMTKLMFLLGQGLSGAGLASAMQGQLRGEITV